MLLDYFKLLLWDVKNKIKPINRLFLRSLPGNSLLNSCLGCSVIKFGFLWGQKLKNKSKNLNWSFFYVVAVKKERHLSLQIDENKTRMNI